MNDWPAAESCGPFHFTLCRAAMVRTKVGRVNHGRKPWECCRFKSGHTTARHRLAHGPRGKAFARFRKMSPNNRGKTCRKMKCRKRKCRRYYMKVDGMGVCRNFYPSNTEKRNVGYRGRTRRNKEVEGNADQLRLNGSVEALSSLEPILHLPCRPRSLAYRRGVLM